MSILITAMLVVWTVAWGLISLAFAGIGAICVMDSSAGGNCMNSYLAVSATAIALQVASGVGAQIARESGRRGQALLLGVCGPPLSLIVPVAVAGLIGWLG